MNMLPWFSLTLQHSYYEDDLCPDLVITPDAATSHMLKGLRAVVKPSSRGLMVALPWAGPSATGPVIAPPKTFVLGFWLTCRNPFFAQFTVLPSTPRTAGECWCWSNQGLNSAGGKLPNPPRGANAMLPADAAGSAASLLGRVELSSGVSLPAPSKTETAAFTLSFEAAAQTWSYFLLDNDGTNSYTVVHDSAWNGGKSLSFGASTIVTSSSLEGEPVLQKFLEAHSGLCLHRVDSLEPVVWRQGGYRLELQRNSSTLMSSLPNPLLSQRGMAMLEISPLTPSKSPSSQS